MVTNLPAEARAQWKRVMEAKTPEQKLEELKKFYSLIPKHKGTKNLIRSVRTQMARLREEIEEKKKKKAGTYLSPWTIPRSGDVRTIIISNDYLTLNEFLDATLGIQEKYMIWKLLPTHYNKIINDIEIEFIVAPPLTIQESIDNRVIGLFPSADYVIAIGKDRESLDEIRSKLLEYGVELVKKPVKINIIKTPSGGIRISNVDPKMAEIIRNQLRNYRIYNAIVSIEGEVSLELFEDLFLGIKRFYKGGYFLWRDGYLIDVELNTTASVRNIGTLLIEKIGLIRVYPVRDFKQKIERPIILRKGDRVIDLAERIHSSLKKNLRYALVKRGNNVIKVSGSFQLEDLDIVSLRAR